MKKLIRIILILLLVQFVADACDEKDECTGTPTEEGKICIKNSDGSCSEIETCSSTKQASPTDDDCRNLKVYDDESKTEKTDFICVLGEKTCIEVKLCTTIKVEEGKDLTDSECNKYGVSKDNAKTHKCIKDPEKNECTEQYLCGSVPKDSKEKDCSLYPVVNSETHTCVDNTEEGGLPCMEAEKPNNNTNSTVNGTQTLSEIVSTNIAKEIESTIIATTIAKEIETTSLAKNETTSITTENSITNQTSIPSTIQGSNTETSIVFLGCSEFQMATSYFTFNIHFIPLLNSLFSNTLTFPLNVIYNTYLRRLEEVNANCNLSL